MPKRGMNKTAMLTAKIEPQLKIEAEQILRELGLNKAQAITMMYKQIIVQRGLPFTISLIPKEKKNTPSQSVKDKQK